jgi:hypothetical protein
MLTLATCELVAMSEEIYLVGEISLELRLSHYSSCVHLCSFGMKLRLTPGLFNSAQTSDGHRITKVASSSGL